MESLTYIKNVKSTPKKLRMIRDLIAKMEPHDALDYLMYATSQASNIYYKAIQSAIANASQSSKVSPDMLKFKLLTIEEGRTLKRHHAGSKGMAKPILKNFAHIKIILESQQKAIPAQVQGVSKKKSKDEKKVNANKIETKDNVAPEKKSIKKRKSVTKKVQK